MVGLRAGPHRPDDPGHLVGDGDGGLVVDVSLGEVVCPAAEPVGLAVARVQQHGTSAVNEQCAQVAVTALGDAAESPLEAARILARRQAEVAREVTSGREAANVADEGE